MYRNFNPRSLGVSGRQSELIELAMTYRFEGMDLNLEEFCKLAESRGIETATRYLASAQIRIAGGDVPLDWTGEEDQFAKQLKRLETWLPHLQQIESPTFYAVVKPASDELPYHENFELHRKRLMELADVVRPAGIRIAVGFSAIAALRKDKAFQFVCEANALVTLIKTVDADNVGLLLDTWHWQVGGGTIQQVLDLGPDAVYTVRLADLPEGADLAAVAEKDRLLPGETNLVPNADWVSRLSSAGCEASLAACPGPFRMKGMTRDRIVQRAADRLKQLLDGESAPASEQEDSDAQSELPEEEAASATR